MNLSLVEAARVMGGSPDSLDKRIRVTGAVADSRLIKPGDAFFALRGDFLDGHDFVAEALLRGASVVVVDRPVQVETGRQIVVPDPMVALVALA
ncbi:MAG TPA: Mur ligase domain-containing protein, partial [Actinomycetota bacterium]|nr:Mur ligase domain-containing protein [Actinomycetota bacterium]